MRPQRFQNSTSRRQRATPALFSCFLPVSSVPMSSQKRVPSVQGGLAFQSAKSSFSHHKSEGDSAPTFEKTSGFHRAIASEISPPSDDPATPVNSRPGSVRYWWSMNGLTSSTTNRQYS